MESIYGQYLYDLNEVMEEITSKIKEYNQQYKDQYEEGIYEHLIYRIKSEESMREKCVRKNLPVTTHSALFELHDAIGIRIVTSFVDDIYKNIERIKKIKGVTVFNEKDYIKKAKENGYRSYHFIIRYISEDEEISKHNPEGFFVEIQLRTIAMDSWAALEHTLTYKKDIKNRSLIENELKRCADELASCDLSMQTIKELIERS